MRSVLLLPLWAACSFGSGAPEPATMPDHPVATWQGLTLGGSTAADVDAWVAAHGLTCTTEPSVRRRTVRTTCRGDLPLGLVADRTVHGRLDELLFVHPDDQPLHHVSTRRLYSLPVDALADFRAAVDALTARYGPPDPYKAVDAAQLDAPIVRGAAHWALPDLQIDVSVMRAGTPYVAVSEVWRIPGVEASVATRTVDGASGASKSHGYASGVAATPGAKAPSQEEPE